ncbi:M16 family metallopeptidase [Oceanotoga teriensis]|uniref:M16 family metallopeptidase n=1 Tax=Oceanotoga teriensis TaxID=515440 RepID=UPI0027124860|nr:pitrilysin family protein [Oceanotoga teriensis]MDO7976401.1 insulinase family protein [Oceanotoga teriensis]
MKKILTLVLFFTLLIFTFSENLQVPKPNYTSYELENGLKIYIFEDHSIPLAKVSVWYNVGSIDEFNGKTGLSHFLEHVMFLGTDSLNKQDIDILLKSVGGTNNAQTSYDYTVYFEEIPSAKLELAIAIEADRMRNLKIDSEEFNREREVVKQERRMNLESNFFQSALEDLQATAFKYSGLNHQVIGWMDDLNNLTVEDMRNHYTTYYAPNNAILSVSGDIYPEDVLTLAKKYFDDYKPQEIKRNTIKEPEQKSENFIKIEKNTNIPVMVMLYKLPAGNSEDIISIGSIMDILVNSQNSRINTRLKLKENVIMEAGALPFLIRNQSYAILYAVPYNESQLDYVKNTFDQELENIFKNGVNDEELEIIKKNTLKSLIFSQKNIKNVEQITISNILKYNDENLLQKNINIVENLNSKDIENSIKKYFVPTNRTVGYIVPKTK